MGCKPPSDKGGELGVGLEGGGDGMEGIERGGLGGAKIAATFELFLVGGEDGVISEAEAL